MEVSLSTPPGRERPLALDSLLESSSSHLDSYCGSQSKSFTDKIHVTLASEYPRAFGS